MVVSVDFDGTITKGAEPEDEGFNEIRPYCRLTMKTLSKMGVEFRLLTARKPEWVQEAVDLCKKWDLPIDTSEPNTKKGSDAFIDDKNLGCTGIDWKVIFIQLYSMIKMREEIYGKRNS